MHGLSERLQKEDFLLCDQKIQKGPVCCASGQIGAVSSSCGVYYKRGGFSADVFEQERR